jgi:hypothetical protein
MEAVKVVKSKLAASIERAEGIVRATRTTILPPLDLGTEANGLEKEPQSDSTTTKVCA